MRFLMKWVIILLVKGANYRETPKVPEKRNQVGRTDGTAGSYVENLIQLNPLWKD